MQTLPDPARFPPCPAPFNLAAHVLGRAGDLADKMALSVLTLGRADRWSFARLKAAVLGTATGLKEMGLQQGDRVLLRLGNTTEFPIAYLGAIAGGFVPVPTSSQLTQEEVAVILKEIRPKLIFHAPDVACPDTTTPSLSPDQLRDMYTLPPAGFDMGDPNRLAYIIYTSGTSGVPRGVMHAHRAIWARQMMMTGWYDLHESDRLCHAGAFNWTYTLGTGLMDPWTKGATALIPGDGIRIDQLPLLMKRHDASIFAAAPGVYRKLLQPEVPLDLPKLRHGLSAGEKLSDTICADWQRLTGKQVYEAYGMSECSTFISACPGRPAPSGTLGFPQEGRRVALVDEDGAPVAPGQEGTIAIHRDDPGLMLGYLGPENETCTPVRGEWFATGDQGIMDNHGAIAYLGRRDDMMNAGGYRVSPIEVERVLNSYPGITQAAVTDIEVKQDARVILAFYTGPEPLTPSELDAFTSCHLASYKCPKGYIHLDTLPTGANGKLLRRDLRPIYKALHDQA